MGKGSNVQKATAARERNQKKLGKTPEERKAATAKARADSTAFSCLLCKQTFMINARPPVLYLHVTTKHGFDTVPATCFPALKDFDPEDPKGEKAAKKEKEAKAAEAKKKKAKNSADLGDLFDSGLNLGKKTKKKFGK
mmetsp:Transcript_15306/g.22430  ORF Transcript_15306/g.22430 Transcript_15306/m.22430 type:complete len:138 (-) Transcript_15306:395-808(-)